MSAFAWINLVVGVLFATGLALAMRAWRSARCAVRVRAKIVGRKSHGIDTAHRQPRSIPVTRFEVELPATSGRPTRLWLGDCIGDSLVESLVGDSGTIPVMHPPGEPERMRIDARATRYVIPVYLCAPAVLWTVVLVYVALAY